MHVGPDAKYLFSSSCSFTSSGRCINSYGNYMYLSFTWTVHIGTRFFMDGCEALIWCQVDGWLLELFSVRHWDYGFGIHVNFCMVYRFEREVRDVFHLIFLCSLFVTLTVRFMLLFFLLGHTFHAMQGNSILDTINRKKYWSYVWFRVHFWGWGTGGLVCRWWACFGLLLLKNLGAKLIHGLILLHCLNSGEIRILVSLYICFFFCLVFWGSDSDLLSFLYDRCMHSFNSTWP